MAGETKTRGLRLHWKILLYFSALLLTLIVAMLVYVRSQAAGFVSGRLAEDLERGSERIKGAENEQLSDLHLTAALVASIPQLNALLGTDLATIRDFLISYQQQNRGPDLLIVLDPKGKVVARTDEVNPEPVAGADAHWVQPALAGQPANYVLPTLRGDYNTTAVPAEAGGTVFGFVIAGSSIDNNFARRLRDVSQGEVVLVDEHILGSTLEGALPWQTRAQWLEAVGGMSGRRVIVITGERYASCATALGSGDSPVAISLQSQDRALAPYRRIQYGLLALGLLAAVAGISGSALLARTVTAPVGKLVEGTQQVAAGNFDFRLDIRSGDEIGDLAQSFNTMTQGLRERADMQKFVSQSTVEMIQSTSQKRISAGERHQVTIFFSDIRGFTSMSERRAPEEVVQILNRCLSLQADRVKKFSGDIDKFVGDAVVAVFDGEDMVLNAIRCGVEIHKELEAYNAAFPEEEPIHIGIGIVTGEVILGSIGSKDRLDFTVIGSNVNLCARLCSAAEAGEILLSESTYQPVKGLISATRLDPLSVKGFSEPVPVYKMTVI
ncbi:MAG TPA: adenylate/guanylate cyclase domain-containing protein [Terriglobia bacterium]|nr:adenylate/guanylate cyclase domain-containing protein [Terriglobia bacterium]